MLQPDNILYFTELIGLPVYDLKRLRLGRLKDLALVPLIHPSRIDRFLVGGEGAWLSIRYDQIAQIDFKGIQLADEQLFPYHSDEYMLRIARDLLDQQIIDVNGRKVVRVTDVTFEVRKHSGHDSLTIVEVDIGVRSIFRRLMRGVLPPALIRRLQEPIRANSLGWDVCDILESDPLRRLRLNISNVRLEKMHPADLADIVQELGPDDREAIFTNIDSEAAAEALSEVDDPRVQASILESLEPSVAADIIEEMSPDEAADVLSELEQDTSEEILEEMEEEPVSDVRELLEYEESTAGGMMNTEYFALDDTATVARAMMDLREQEYLIETLNVLLLIDSSGRLTASVPIARLFLAQGDTPLKQLASEDLIFVDVDEQQDRVVELFDKYNVLTLPVVNKENRLAGVITADDVISVLRHK